MPSRRRDPGYAGQDEQGQPYQGKHRAPESKSWRRKRGVANIALEQPVTAPHPSPDTPGSASPEIPGDQQTANDQQAASGQHPANDQQAASGQHAANDQHTPSGQHTPNDRQTANGQP